MMSDSTAPKNLLICTACGTQFDVEDRTILTRCNICDDERQFVPPTGQAFTTIAELRSGGHENRWQPLVVADEPDPNFWSIWTEPKFAIGQRAILIRTPRGNILWDCITYLDTRTVDWINSLGGLAAIVISHPHYYSTHLEWAATFHCPVYLSSEDKSWLNRPESQGKARMFIHSTFEDIEVRGQPTGVKAIKLGGHFPGSLVCLAHGRLLVADTLVTIPAGLGDWSKGPGGGREGRPEGMNTYAFMWSIPNMIPLDPGAIVRMWKVLKEVDFRSTHGAFLGQEVWDKSYGGLNTVKRRVLASMQIQIRRMGGQESPILEDT